MFTKKVVVVFIAIAVIMGAGIVPGNTIFESDYPVDSNHSKSTIVLYPSSDTHLNHRAPTVNYGSDTQLEARNEFGSGGSDGWAWDSLIQFDLSSIPTGSTVTSAYLCLYYYNGLYSPQGRPINLYKVTSSWGEYAVTWDNQPSYDSLITSTTSVPSSYGWMSWTVTTDVQDFIDGSQTNYGWKLTDETYWGSASIPEVVWHSREYSNSDFHPYLELEIIEPNDPPVAQFSYNPENPEVNEPITFDASSSSDSDGSIIEYEWDFGDDNTSMNMITTHSYEEPGFYTVSLTVMDDDGEHDTTFQSIEVEDQNFKPTAFFDYTPTTAYVNDSILFNASESNDSDGTIIEYEWDFGDGELGNGMIIDHSYQQSGTYTVNLTVTDDDGANDSREETISVLPERNHEISIEGITGGFGITIEILNIGTADASQIPWSISCIPGFLCLILSENTSSGVVSELAISQSEWIRVLKPRGIGPMNIIVQVDEEIDYASGFLLGPLVLRVQQQ